MNAGISNLHLNPIEGIAQIFGTNFSKFFEKTRLKRNRHEKGFCHYFSGTIYGLKSKRSGDCWYCFEPSLIMIDPSLSNDNHEYVETAFPLKLHVVLDEAEKRGFSDVISWQGNKAFMIHKPKKFQDSIMSEYFNQTEYKSFQKQRKFHFFVRGNIRV